MFNENLFGKSRSKKIWKSTGCGKANCFSFAVCALAWLSISFLVKSVYIPHEKSNPFAICLTSISGIM